MTKIHQPFTGGEKLEEAAKTARRTVYALEVTDIQNYDKNFENWASVLLFGRSGCLPDA